MTARSTPVPPGAKAPKRRATRKSAGEDRQEAVPPVPPVPETADDVFGRETKTPPPDETPPSPKAREARKPGRTPALQTALEELFATPALAYSFAGDAWAAELVATRSKEMAAAWYELSTKNAAVKRVLGRLVEGSAWGGVAMSTAAILIPLAQHHGLVPGADPFAPFYPPLPADGTAGPIVPPPPSDSHRSPGSNAGNSPRPQGGGGGTTPPPPAGDPTAIPGAVVIGQNGQGGRAS